MSSKVSVTDTEDSYNGQLLMDIKEVSKALYLTNETPHKPPLSILPHNKKKKSLWDWKKPLKAIAHLGQRRFDVCFLLHVHSIEGLPSSLDGTKLVVQWQRKDEEAMSTQPSKVYKGAAEFEETLTHRCSVYCTKHGPHRSAKYEVKLFLVYASPIDAPWVVIGKHWIDLTRILPLSLEELEGERSTRKWSTSLKLSGLADSALLNVSFDYSVCDSSSRNVMLRRVGSVPSLDRRASPLDLSQSIDFLYEKLNKQNPQRPTETDKQGEGKGVEMFQQERSMLEENTEPNTGSSGIEIIDIHEILKDEDEDFFEETCITNELLPKDSVFEGPKSASESSESKSSLATSDTTEKGNFLEVKSSYKTAKTLTKSLSLDDITESVANDFLNMLEFEECSYGYSSDKEPTSPREHLLREFEKEVLASGSFLLDLDREEAECVSDIDKESNDFSFSSSSLALGGYKPEGKSQMLINRRKAKLLEDLETETSMRKWDLEDCSDGFGSPIELPLDKGSDLLPFTRNSDEINQRL